VHHRLVDVAEHEAPALQDLHPLPDVQERHGLVVVDVWVLDVGPHLVQVE
jgi:hypothetical protein